MPITFLRHRFATAVTVGAIIALSALALPTAANAAEVCATGNTPTAATKPWQDFVNSGNTYGTIEFTYSTAFADITAAVGAVTPGITQGELDAITAQVNVAYTTATDAATTNASAFDNSLTTLENALLAANPANGPATEAFISGNSTALQASQYGTPLNDLFNAYLTEISDYLTAVQDAIDAVTPAPVLPASVTDATTAILAGISGFDAFVEVLYYDAAAAQVKCAAVLAETGVDAAPTALAGATLLIAGTAFVLATRRRERAQA